MFTEQFAAPPSARTVRFLDVRSSVHPAFVTLGLQCPIHDGLDQLTRDFEQFLDSIFDIPTVPRIELLRTES